MTNNDDWDFKLDKDASVKKTVEPKKPTPKPKLEDIAKAFSDDAPVDLTLDHEALPPRSARNENFKKTVALERFADIKPAPLVRRVQAALVDLVFVAILGFGAWLSFPMFKVKLERSLPSGMLSGLPHPELILEFSLPVLAILVLHLLPTAFSRKSLGKRLFNLRIGYKDDDCGISKKAVLWRELIAKPISAVCVIGVLLIFINKRGRGLHDFLSGSVVYDEL
tara:strand:+ start:6249 stop:6917 length:669 start_codon:yes stop_codon:yes gene_type:complete